MDPSLATAVRTTVVVVFAWMIAFSLGTHGGLVRIERRAWIFLTASGVATGLSWLCYFRALSLADAFKVPPIDKLSVVFVIALAAPILGEAITTRKVIGGALMRPARLCLLLIAQLRSRRRLQLQR